MTDARYIHEGLPLFYRSVRPLDRERDANLYISPPYNFNFAATTNAIPILAEEISIAAAHYPIVFAEGSQPILAAVVGLNQDQNIFIDQNGQWLSGAYLPSYVRRYPFLLMDDSEKEQFVLCVDDESDQLGVDGGARLFENGEPSEITRAAMEFCVALNQQGNATTEFIQALQTHEMLTPINSNLEILEKEIQLTGLMVIDPDKFDALPDTVILDWRKHGWLSLVYAFFLSSHRWPNLVSLHNNRKDALPISDDIVAFRPLGGQDSSSMLPTKEEFRLLHRPNKEGRFD